MPEKLLTIDDLCINTIRTLVMDAVEAANSGHPGAPMGLAPAGYILWTRIMKHNPKNPSWQDRDRFVLSCGHASMLLYSLLYLTGYDLSLDDIRNFRQWGSKTPGHPEFGVTPGVETTTGPLGQGFANAVGMAIAERHLAARFNKPGHQIVDHYTYMFCGDGDMMEGISSEAASLAGHLGLSRLICIYDDNHISIEGNTNIAFTENVAARFEALNWFVQKVNDGNNLDAVYGAIQAAKIEPDRPSLIVLRTHIAFGSPNKQDKADSHGAPLGAKEVSITKKNLGFPEDKNFYTPEDVLKHCRACIKNGEQAQARWQKTFEAYKKAYPDLAAAWTDAVNKVLTPGWDEQLPKFSPQDGSISTRVASGKTINALAKAIPSLIGGSADLSPSTMTDIESSHDFQKGAYDGRIIRFGVREHAMGAILAGIEIHGGLRPFGGTFLVFADYMRPAIRVAALMKLPVIYIFTHDSIAVGEDGPTHQPIEQLASLRMIPGLTVIRPADAAETVFAWKAALENHSGPTALILSRQKLPVIDRSRYSPASGLLKGAYILTEAGNKQDIILIATGSELHIAIEAHRILKEKGISAKLVNMPSWELFDAMPKEYRDEVIPPDIVPRIVVEAGIPFGWERYIGAGVVIGITDFGKSAPGEVVMKSFGFTPENIAQKAIKMLN